MIAWRGVNTIRKEKYGWADAIYIQREILELDSRSEKRDTNELEEQIRSGELQSRGLYEKSELEYVCQWVQDRSDPEMQLAAAKVIASSLFLSATKFTLSRSEICKYITHKSTGCLNKLLEFVSQRAIKLHTEIPFDEIKFGKEIGTGTAGSVFQAEYKGKVVAAKRFKGVSYDDFMKELSIMSIVEHPNLVKCYGGCSDNNMVIVQELMQANISDILRMKAISLDIGIRMRIGLEVAKGLQFLHSHCNLIHRDLKSLNLLAIIENDIDLIIKVCDFGVSRVVDKRKTMTGNVGTVSWIAPEIFEQRKYSEKADIYSFGIVLWELFTRKVPFTDIHSFSIPVAVIKGARPQIPKDCPSLLKKLIRSCWDAKPSKRPSLPKIIESLQRIVEQLPASARKQTVIDLSPISKTKRQNSTFNLRKGGTHFDELRASSSHTTTTTTTTTDTSTFDSESPDSHEITDSPNHSLKKKSTSQLRQDSDSSTHTRTVTCMAPEKWAPPLAKLEVQVNKYFSKLKQDLDMGTIHVNDERYVLFRGKSLALDFLNMVRSSFSFESEEQSLEFSQNFLYDLGYAVGKADAEHFLKSTNINDDVAKNNAGLVHIAYTGMAFVNLLPESVFSTIIEDECLIYEYTYSFESESWIKENKLSDCSTCMMSAGYLAGWGESATGEMRAAAEIKCKSKGDEKCLFVRAAPFKLESMVKRFGSTEPLPKFLKNRADTTMPYRKKVEPNESDVEDNEHWFRKSIKSLVKKIKTSKVEIREPASPITPQKFNYKLFTQPSANTNDIEVKANEELNSFFIDPTTATVEMASERCVLLRGDSLSFRFFNMVHELFGDSQDESTPSKLKNLSDQFVFKFLFDLGRTIGISNLNWFTEKLALNDNPIEKSMSLSVNMAYFGWCDLVFRSGLSSKEIQKAKENFSIECDVYNSFEAVSWLKNKSKKNQGNPVCYMHAGYISGWFESSFKTSVVAVETQCRSQGHKYCKFMIAHKNNIKKMVPQSVVSNGLTATATTSGVLPLLSKFKERRRDSTPTRLTPTKTPKSGRDSPTPRSRKTKRFDSPIPRVNFQDDTSNEEETT